MKLGLAVSQATLRGAPDSGVPLGAAADAGPRVLGGPKTVR